MSAQNIEKFKSEAASTKVSDNAEEKYVVQFDRKNCIGVFSCTAVLADAWKVASDGKADLAGSTEKEPELFELEISRKELAKMLESAEVCPVNVIHIFEKKTGRKII